MMQGDSYNLKIKLQKKDKTPVTPEDLTNLEVTIGGLTKTYGSGQVKYNAEIDRWLFPLSQDETFSFVPSVVDAQIRVVGKDGSVRGFPLGKIDVLESISKEVL